jgi:Cytochrome P460
MVQKSMLARRRDWQALDRYVIAQNGAQIIQVAFFVGHGDGQLPYPDGTIIARVAWSYVPLEESKKAFGRPQSFVAGPPKNGVQFMVKDSRKYASTGGWGFAHFDDGKPASEAVQNTCFPCHEIVKARDFIFNRYAP